MKQEWEKEVQDGLNREISFIDFPKEAEDRILTQIHHQIQKGRKTMKWTKKQTRLILAAAMVIIGATTAIGAGKIAFTQSGHSINDELHNADQLKRQAEETFGEKIRMPEKFSDGTSFVSGIVSDVEGMDENGNLVDTRPELYANYKRGNINISLTVAEPFSDESPEKKQVLLSETCNGIAIEGTEDHYLFLPPDAVPSEEDKRLEAEGKLMISYGSSEEERKVFKNVGWDEGGLHYLLFTFDDIQLSDIAALAKEIISSQQ